MEPTNTGIIIRQQGWFRPLVYTDNLSPFPVDQIDSVLLAPTGVFRARVILGKGPVERDLQSYVFPWFEHGEKDYPTFECPSIGPVGAGLIGTNKTHRLSVSAEEALGLIEISLIQPVAKSFREGYEKSSNESPDSSAGIVQQWLDEAKFWLEQVIGLYALYQFPVVWETLGIFPLVGFVDLAEQTFKHSTNFSVDNFIPFRLRVDSKLKENNLVDGGLTDLAKLANHKLHFPLLLLQRCLWQRNVELRFLEAFLVLDYLAGQAELVDPKRQEREKLHQVILECIKSRAPEFEQRVQNLKHVILQAPLKERLLQYLSSLKIEIKPDTLRMMLKFRNDLAHARPVDRNTLIALEVELRRIVREVFRRDLASKGINFEEAA